MSNLCQTTARRSPPWPECSYLHSIQLPSRELPQSAPTQLTRRCHNVPDHAQSDRQWHPTQAAARRQDLSAWSSACRRASCRRWPGSGPRQLPRRRPWPQHRPQQWRKSICVSIPGSRRPRLCSYLMPRLLARKVQEAELAPQQSLLVLDEPAGESKITQSCEDCSQEWLSAGGKVEIHERRALHEASRAKLLGLNRDRRGQHAIRPKMRVQNVDVIHPVQQRNYAAAQ